MTEAERALQHMREHGCSIVHYDGPCEWKNDGQRFQAEVMQEADRHLLPRRVRATARRHGALMAEPMLGCITAGYGLHRLRPN